MEKGSEQYFDNIFSKKIPDLKDEGSVEYFDKIFSSKKDEIEKEGPNSLSRLVKMPLAGAANAVETMVNSPSTILNITTPIVSKKLDKVIPNENKRPVEYKTTDFLTKMTGDLKPETDAEKVLYGAGEFAVPIPGLGVASKATKLSKKIASHLIDSFGLSTAINATPSITQEGTFLRFVEDLIKGGLYGGGKSLLKPKETAAKISSMGTKPNEEVLKTAEKHGIDLPVNVGLNSSALNATTNLLKHSPFSVNEFKQSFTNANQQTLNAIKRNLDKLGPDVPPSSIGHDFNIFLKEQEQEVKKVVDNVYDEARKHLTAKDAAKPENTKKTIDAMKDILEREYKSPQTKKVTSTVIEVANSLGLTPKSLKLPNGWQEGDLSQNTLKQILENIQSSSKEVPLQKLLDAKTEIGNALKHKQDVVGMENWLKGLQGSIAKDIDSTTNLKFKDSIKNAQKFYQESYAARFRADLAKSVLTGAEPLYIYNNLNSLKNIVTLEKIAGNTPRAREIVDALKKAKAREIFNKAITEEGVHAGNYSNLFSKSEINQEYLKGLLGKEVYKDLKEISRITTAMSKSGQEMLNTSNTAYIQQYMNTLSKLGKGVAGTLGGVVGGAVALSLGSLKTLGAAAGGVAANRYVSKLMVDPKYVKLTRQFAIQNSKGNASLPILKKMTERAAIILRSDIENEERE